MTAITAERLNRTFGDLVAVDDLSFEVPTGGVVGFVGPNGSGKSTTIRLLLGLITPTSGSGTVLGHPISSPELFADRVGALIEGPSFLGAMSAKANLESLAALRRIPSSRVGAVLDIVGLTGRENEKVATYSLGMKQRLGIASALLPDPDLLILDEPTNGLDPAGIVEIRTLLQSLASEGRTVLVSSHLMSEIQAMAHDLIVIRFGKLLYSGPLAGLMEDAGERVIIAPEHVADLEPLVAAIGVQGWSCEALDDEVVVDIAASDSPELARIAHEAGLTLRKLMPKQDDLEDVFLRMTGETDSALAIARSQQRVRGEAT